jgi:nitrate/nitrite transporter NarK
VAIFLPASVVAVLMRLTGGWISDHVRLKYMLMTGLAGVACSAIGLVYLSAGWTVWLMIVGNGMAIALIDLLSAMVWPRYYGRTHLGAISGQVMAMTVFASALGPIVFSQSLTRTGTYTWAGWVCLAVTAVLLVGAWWARNPQIQETGDKR